MRIRKRHGKVSNKLLHRSDQTTFWALGASCGLIKLQIKMIIVKKNSTIIPGIIPARSNLPIDVSVAIP
jgi:hypothetical protein